MEPTPILYMTVGLPRSGKSTWAIRYGEAPVVSPDAIRLAVHGQAFLGPTEPMVWVMSHYMVESLFLAGHRSVILDCTNISFNRRKEWLLPKWGVEYVIFDTPADVCIERARVNGREDLVPVIEAMAKQIPEGGFGEAGELYRQDCERLEALRSAPKDPTMGVPIGRKE